MSKSTATTEEILARLAAAERQLATYEAERAAWRTVRPRRRGRGRLVAALALALLVALVPMGILAAGPFGDLDPAQGGPTGHNPNIQAIADAGITKGCNPPDNTLYCPKDVVTREQMASFLARTAGLGGNPPVANAATAVNANNLGGQPASAYARAAQFKAVEVIDRTGAGSLSATYTSNGGILLIFFSASAYRNAPGTLAVTVNITGPASVTNEIGTFVYTNEGGSHKALPSEVEVRSDLPAGTYTFTFVLGAGTLANGDDSFHLSVLEIPRP